MKSLRSSNSRILRRRIRCYGLSNELSMMNNTEPAIVQSVKSNYAYSDFLRKVKNHEIDIVEITPGSNEIKFSDKETGEISKSNVIMSESLLEKLTNEEDLELYVKSSKSYFGSGLSSIFSFAFIIGFYYLLMNNLPKNIQSRLPMGNKEYNIDIDENLDIKFSDVAGIESELHEVKEIVEFLKNPKKYEDAGAKVPKGCLLCGPPGTGKTLLAKAIAGESGVPFISCSASEFIELFVGLGASRIRNLFMKARENSPCIIFIDEIDAIGKQRGGNMNVGASGNDEREQTLNQLLTEMDGFGDNSGVILLGATNRVDILDKALLRPGRFDRKINVTLPDNEGRLKILEVHSKNKELDVNVNLEEISKKTIGFSGADLMNIMNEAAIIAGRNDDKIIKQNYIDEAYEKITIGLPKTKKYSEHTKKIVAYHEAGHTLTGMLLNNFDEVSKVTIIPRGNSGGVTQFLPVEDNDLQMYTREYLLNKIMVGLGGRVSEEIIFGHNAVTTGAASDLEMISSIAKKMVTSYGFSDILGSNNLKNVSSNMEYEIDVEVKRIICECYERTYILISNNMSLLHKIAELLIEKETLSVEDLYAIKDEYPKQKNQIS